ncbi:MAG: transcriptional repressor [Proteobacteria bacterium]|nr:MAG: transcriptional repressor [Pseudomonadota bacterium]
MSRAASFQEMCVKTLKESGARLTKPRLALIDCLSHATVAMSPKEIFQRTEALLTKDKSESIDTVTVYRILDRFAELGLVHRVAPNGDYIACTHLACATSPHIMTRCVQCQAAREMHIPEDIIAPLLWFMRTQKKFEPKEHLFQLDGICENCRPAVDPATLSRSNHDHSHSHDH